MALTNGAKQIGYELISRTAKYIEIKNIFTLQTEKYEVLAEFPFDSNWKRMSLIVKYENDYYIYTKGADSTVLPKINFDTMTQI